MRPGNNNNRRGRNRGPRKPHGGMPNKNQNFDNNGSETRVRGNVYQVLEKYLQLARDAGVSGDRIAAENFLQHADHYYRVITTMNDGQRPRIGGREISVADVNVQNVSQGLSAALYSGGPSQPNLNDTAVTQAPSHSSNDAVRSNENYNGQGGNASNGQSASVQSDNGQDSHQSNGDGSSYQSNAQQAQNRDRDRPRHRREFRHNDNQRENRHSHYRQSDQSRMDQAPGDQNSIDRSQSDYSQANHRDSSERKIVNDYQAETPPPPVVQVTDEQPDYPEHLLPQTEASPEAERAARRPRMTRTRRPRSAESDGEIVEASPDKKLNE